MDLAAYYKTELAFVHEMARAFAEVHPSTAGLLKEKSNDPDVERLIQAFAFQAATIRARIDQTAPNIVHGLAELLLPHYLRPLPAATIVEFTPNLATLRSRQVLPAGRLLTTRTIAGTACRFRTCFDVELFPLEVVDLKVDERVSALPVLRLRLRCTDCGKAAMAQLQRLRLFFHHSEPSLPATLLLWLSEYCRGVAVRAGDDDRVLGRLDARAIHMSGAEPTAAVFPWPRTTPHGYRMLLEHFAIPEKQQFVDVLGLDRVPLGAGEFVVCFELERPPPLPVVLQRGSVRLHCTPAVNLFDASAQPVRHTPLVQEHLLRAEKVSPAHMEVYEVRSVIGAGQERSARRPFEPFYRFARVDAPSYALRRTAAIDGATDTYLSLIDGEGGAEDAENISIELTCTNRLLPRELHIGDVQGAPAGALFKSYTNITPVSPPVRVPLGSDALWRLVSHLALNQRGLTDAVLLRAMLNLYNFVRGIQPMSSRNEQQIDAIRMVTQEGVTRMIRGVPIRAVRTTVELDEAALPGGSAFMLGTVLHELYGSLTPLNAASQVRVVLHPTGTELKKWPVKTGG